MVALDYLYLTYLADELYEAMQTIDRAAFELERAGVATDDLRLLRDLSQKCHSYYERQALEKYEPDSEQLT